MAEPKERTFEFRESPPWWDGHGGIFFVFFYLNTKYEVRNIFERSI
jgi:hypothetical protein